MHNLFYSLISLTVALFFLMVGVLSILLPWSPMVRADLIQFILEDSIAIFLFGFIFVIVGLAIVITIILGTRRSYFRLRGGLRSVAIDENVVQDYLDTYWKQVFPKTSVPTRLVIKKNKIHLVADLPHVPSHEQKDLLEKVKHDLTGIFSSFLGYREPFTLNASFEPESPKK